MPTDPSSKFYLYKRKLKQGSKRHPTGIYLIGYYLHGKRKWKSTEEEMKSVALRRLSELKRLIE